MSSNLKLDWCSHTAAKFAVENWHYSQCMPAGKTVKIGAWESGKFIGVVIFSRGANSSLGNPYGLTQMETCELTRVALTNHETTVTRIVSIAIAMLRKQSPGMRLIISFADPEQGHKGGIYQGGNWVFCGRSNAADEYLVNGKRMHGRSMRSLYGTHVGKSFIQQIKGSSKYRYLMPLDAEMRERIKPLAKPYPKRVASIDADAVAFHAAEGGSIPTATLHKVAVK